MKSFLNVVKVLSVMALVTSCAYENDPGLTRKDGKATELVNDPLKGKSTPDLLKIKYTSLTATCNLSRAAKAADVAQPSAEEAPKSAEPVTPPVAAKPVDNQGAKTIIDFKAQAVEDAALAKTIDSAALEVSDEHTKSNLKLVIKPLSFQDTLTLNVDSLVYVMKHSPELSGSFSHTYNNGTSTLSNKGVLSTINEKVPFSQVVLEETVGETVFEHVLSCELAGVVDAANDTVKGQWIKVDCSGAVPTDAEELKVYKSSCKPKVEEPAPATTK